MIASTEDSEDVNHTGYPFEEYGYAFRGVETIYYDIFLSYKIEREIFKGFESDSLFSINAVSKEVFSLDDLTLLVEDAKLRYLVDKKTGSMEAAGFIDMTVNQLEALIKSKMQHNYIYNLSLCAGTTSTNRCTAACYL